MSEPEAEGAPSQHDGALLGPPRWMCSTRRRSVPAALRLRAVALGGGSLCHRAPVRCGTLWNAAGRHDVAAAEVYSGNWPRRTAAAVRDEAAEEEVDEEAGAGALVVAWVGCHRRR